MKRLDPWVVRPFQHIAGPNDEVPRLPPGGKPISKCTALIRAIGILA